MESMITRILHHNSKIRSSRFCLRNKKYRLTSTCRLTIPSTHLTMVLMPSLWMIRKQCHSLPLKLRSGLIGTLWSSQELLPASKPWCIRNPLETRTIHMIPMKLQTRQPMLMNHQPIVNSLHRQRLNTRVTSQLMLSTLKSSWPLDLKRHQITRVRNFRRLIRPSMRSLNEIRILEACFSRSSRPMMNIFAKALNNRSAKSIVLWCHLQVLTTWSWAPLSLKSFKTE